MTGGESDPARLRAIPGMQRVPSARLELFQLRKFLAPDLCARLVALIDRHRRASTIADDNGDALFRTSETCDLEAGEPAVRELEAQLHRISGIDPAFGEPVQGQRYDVGQEFKPHTDYFAPDGADYARYCAHSGQRSWTFMAYLNEPAAGAQPGSRPSARPSSPKPASCWRGTTGCPMAPSTPPRSITG